MSNGKGSKRRKCQVDYNTYKKNWDNIFKNKQESIDKVVLDYDNTLCKWRMWIGKNEIDITEKEKE